MVKIYYDKCRNVVIIFKQPNIDKFEIYFINEDLCRKLPSQKFQESDFNIDVLDNCTSINILI